MKKVLQSVQMYVHVFMVNMISKKMQIFQMVKTRLGHERRENFYGQKKYVIEYQKQHGENNIRLLKLKQHIKIYIENLDLLTFGYKETPRP